MNRQYCDIAIIGGGVAGLWIFALLKARGFSVVLIEKNELGGGQSGFSQGILHAGVKYSLAGKTTASAEATHQAIRFWQEALEGKGPLNLSSLTPLSKHHSLVMPGGWQAQLKAMLTTQLVSSECRQLSKEDYPSFFKQPAFKGVICQFDEIVLDVPALILLFFQKFSEHFLHAETVDLVHDEKTDVQEIVIQEREHILTISPRFVVLTAGEGNEALLSKAPEAPLMQRRPLHMVAVKHPDLQPIWIHIVEKGSTPSLTITTHGTEDFFWYLGGELAEKVGVLRSEREQVQASRIELERHFPWLSLERASWRLIRINRAEGQTEGGNRPDSAIVKMYQNRIVCWPTKLVLAPVMAYQVVERIEKKSRPCLERANLDWAYRWPKPQVSRGIQGIWSA